MYRFARTSALPCNQRTTQPASGGRSGMVLSFGHDSISKLTRFWSKKRVHAAALALSLLTASGFAVLCSAPMAYAQTSVTGALSGVVTDQSGAAVQGASVT